MTREWNDNTTHVGTDVDEAQDAGTRQDMTRENKLALVVGFGLILFVGILLSDHFSTARQQQSADLTDETEQRPVAARLEDPDLIDFEPSKPKADNKNNNDRNNTGQPAMRPERTATNSEVRPLGRDAPKPGFDVIEMGETPEVGLDDKRARELTWRFHHVQKGESLITICREYYGDGSLAAELAKFNEIDNPDRINVGRTLRIPKAEVLIRGHGPVREQNNESSESRADERESSSQQNQKYRTYTVKKGDMLSELARRFLGSGKRWGELYELNKDVIDDPDNVVVGTVIKVPRNAR